MLFSLDRENFIKFQLKYAREEDCIDLMFSLKWPEGYQCPRCRHAFFYQISTRRLPLYQCRSCHTQTSLIAGTLMEGSRTPLHLWFHAIFLHAQPLGVNARQLSQAIGVTYKTAWLMSHKIRHAMTQSDSGKMLSGIVRVSDSVYSKRMVPTFDWHPQEQPLLIGSSDDINGEPSFIVVKHQSKASLKDRFDCPDPRSFIQDHVHPDSIETTVFTRRYGPNMNKKLAWMGYEITRWIGMIYRGIGPKHLQAYLNQFCYSYNRSKSPIYPQLLADCIASRRITYPALTRKSLSSPRSLQRVRTWPRPSAAIR